MLSNDNTDLDKVKNRLSKDIDTEKEEELENQNNEEEHTSSPTNTDYEFITKDGIYILPITDYEYFKKGYKNIDVDKELEKW